jgi:hypothetical protein
MSSKALYHEKWCHVAQDAVSYQPAPDPTHPWDHSKLDDTTVRVLRKLGAGPGALNNLDTLFSLQHCGGDSNGTYLESLRKFIEDKMKTIPTVGILYEMQLEPPSPVDLQQGEDHSIPEPPAEPVPIQVVSQRCECQCIMRHPYREEPPD